MLIRRDIEAEALELAEELEAESNLSDLVAQAKGLEYLIHSAEPYETDYKEHVVNIKKFNEIVRELHV